MKPCGRCEGCTSTCDRPSVPRVSGILNLYKPPRLTSHDVVDQVRRITGTRRVGHAGTLDPMATGVLLVCVGEATRVAEYLMRGRKVYRAEVLFGVATDTDDLDGEVVARESADSLDRQEVEAGLAGFVGVQRQRPPTYSAIKREGTPLYALARRGVKVEVAPREVVIHRARLVAWLTPVATIEVECSSGTYIRALARDLGAALGCGATLRRLTRLACGRFGLGSAVKLDELAEAGGAWREFLHPLDEALLDLPALVVGPAEAAALRRGQGVAAPEGKGWARVYSPEGDIVALAEFDPDGGRWRPRKVFGAADAVGARTTPCN